MHACRKSGFALALSLFLAFFACSCGEDYVNKGNCDTCSGATDGDVVVPDGDEEAEQGERIATCYTPCKVGAMLDGKYVPCSDEGLMEGCLGKTVCRDGWCVLEDSAEPSSRLLQADQGDRYVGDGTCHTDCDCPEHGACIQGSCGSNCEAGRHGPNCQSGFVCNKKVCRQACSSSANACATGAYCQVGADGVNGVCMPLCQPEEASVPDTSCLLSAQNNGESPFTLGGIDLTENILTFTEDRPTATFEIVNNTLCPLSFDITKIRHVKYDGEGSTLTETNPLYWLSLKDPDGNQDADGVLKVTIEPQATVAIAVADAFNREIPNWSGDIEIKNNEQLGATTLSLSFSSGATGYYMGKMYFFANFGSDNLDAWLADKDNASLLNSVNNAFLKRWDVLKRGEITADNFLAMIDSTMNGSWGWPTIKAACTKKQGACYPFANPDEGDRDDGIENYSDDLARDPIPTGMVELPIALALRQDETEAKQLSGRVVSRETLHYAGDPAIRLDFEQNASECAAVGEFQVCLNGLSDMGLDVVVGGRYYGEPGSTDCPEGTGFEQVSFPWLPADFMEDTNLVDGVRYKAECRDTYRPYNEQPSDSDVAKEDLNKTLAGSNPLPDGRTLQRSLKLIDGALIAKDRLFVIFKEEFLVELGGNPTPEDFTAYGFMVLRRTSKSLESTEFTGSRQTEDRAMPAGVLGVECSQDILDLAGFNAMPTSEADKRALAEIMIDGVATSSVDLTGLELSQNVHYLCWETGQFDQGETGSRGCPLGSPITFFFFNSPDPDLQIENCQLDAVFEDVYIDGYTKRIVVEKGSCDQVFNDWKVSRNDMVVDPFWQCDNGEDVCDKEEDRTDGKVFYDTSTLGDEPTLLKLDTSVNDAFRYKTAFRNRSGKNLGFTPDICVEGSTAVPYCYAPWKIEESRHRVDCALYLYLNEFNTPGDATADLLLAYLKQNFSSRCIDDSLGAEACHRPQNQQDGFESLNAELLVMLGDESYTRAFASRFDLAGTNKAGFDGSLFEPSGINLSGVAGYEMYSLYQATQYYQLALDRFYSLLPALSIALSNSSDSIITAETVSNYLDRLIRASTQKSRSWSAAAKHYQSLNRPDLARRVIQRAYTATYLESVLISRMMHNVIDAVPPENEAQILSTIEQAQLSYKAALLEMRDVNKDITDDVNYFGFAPDYVPFPAMDEVWDINAFEKLLASAKTSTSFAAENEEKALNGNRDYETDSASFQAELASIRNTYETQLYEMCGTFVGDDGGAYPAIIEYAHLNQKSRLLADPCGLMGNGEIYEAMMDVKLRGLDLQGLISARYNVLQRINIENERITAVCEEISDLSDYTLAMEGTKMTLQAAIYTADTIVNAVKRAEDTITNAAVLSACSIGTSTNCPTAGAAISMVVGASAATNAILTGVEIGKAAAQLGIMGAEMAKIEFGFDSQCDLATIDSVATIKNLVLDMLTADHDILKGALELQVAYSGLEKAVNTSKLIRAEYMEIWQQRINVEAARNDPNVRIYKNDAVINADKAFNVALKSAYRATKVFEYYTSQSYAHLVDLFLVRMVASGDYNLENYLMGLENEFYTFEEQYGNPDTRLAIISLKDDVFRIPEYSDEAAGVALGQAERNRLFVEALTKTENLTEHGYAIPFNTRLEDLSPLTRNHKILYFEAQFIGENLGDELGRIYLTQSGTGAVYSVTGEKTYYRLPPRTAVVNTYFNGEMKIANTEVYAARKLRDRPLANSEWTLLFDPAGEPANRDIEIEGISDIVLHVYYSDFTSLDY
ncbi:MAG: hypothetical protein C4523_01510 [Myxococcales bacterium]|nr:MAG: hypothetical protein C4523_01510 [Myxococcales bacterium]